jgi:hypothetical protein
MRGGGGAEESVYALGAFGSALGGGAPRDAPAPRAPRVATHRVAAPGAKPKMHVDSSQVGGGTRGGGRGAARPARTLEAARRRSAPTTAEPAAATARARRPGPPRPPQVASCLNPVRGVRDAQRRAGIKPTDHARQNALAVKERSRLNALRRLSEVRGEGAGAGRGGGAGSRRRAPLPLLLRPLPNPALHAAALPSSAGGL